MPERAVAGSAGVTRIAGAGNEESAKSGRRASLDRPHTIGKRPPSHNCGALKDAASGSNFMRWKRSLEFVLLAQKLQQRNEACRSHPDECRTMTIAALIQPLLRAPDRCGASARVLRENFSGHRLFSVKSPWSWRHRFPISGIRRSPRLVLTASP